MQLLLNRLAFVNDIFINIAMIVSTILTYYFVSLHMGTKKTRTNLSFVSTNLFNQSKLWVTILVGILLGLVSFILSINRISIFGESNGVDMRYVILYFAVIYGSELLGIITSLTLISLKYASYLIVAQEIHFSEYFNNFIFTFFLLALTIYMRRKDFSIWRSHLTFLGAFMFIRFSLFSIYFHPFFQLRKLSEFGVYLVLYSAIFLLATFIINAAITVTQSVHVYRKAAIFDSLTGVYNKESFHFFLDYVANNISQNEQDGLSLAVIDIDNFKDVNDSFGHPIGDLALNHVASILSRFRLESIHYVCRIGGDEFAIIHNQEPQEAEAYFEDVFSTLEQHPFIFDEEPIRLAISVGLAHFKITSDFNIEVALQEADSALYAAKNNGKEQLVVTRH